MKMNINNIQGAIFMGYMVDKMRNMSFRQYSFEKKLRDIEAEMSGRNRSFLPEITDVNGVVSEERIDSFIAANVDRIEEYGTANNMWRENGFRSVTSEHMPDVLREYLSDFMYLAIKVILTEDYLGDEELVELPVATFEQIYMMAEELGSGEMRYGDVFTEFYCGGVQRANLLAYCDSLYELLSGERIKSLITDEMLDRANKLYEKDVERINGSYQEIEDLPEEIREEMEDWSESVTGEEMPELIGICDVQNPDVFCTKYRRFREIYFSDELPQDIDLANVVKRMLNIYLCSINASSYGFEDTFSDSYIYMKRAQRMVSYAAKKHAEGGADD